MPNRKAGEIIEAVFFIGLAIVMYYCLTGEFRFQVYITYRHAVALLIVACGCISFLIRPNVSRGIIAVKSSLAFCVPELVVLMVSLFIWSYNQEPINVINRGLSTNFIYLNNVTAVFAAGVFLYMFGEKGIWYNLVAILTVNLIMIAMIIAESGIGPFMREMATLILTFAEDTGDIIGKAEIHELAFCLGAYLVYMILFPRKKVWFWVLFLLALFCFVAAFKRIAIGAMMIVIPIGALLRLMAKKKLKRAVSQIITVLMVGLTAALLIYIAFVKFGLFEMLEKIGIDTMSRKELYEWANQFYEFSPGYIGRGIGFLTYHLQLEGQQIEKAADTIHNDFLQYFIDLGFWGYIIWLLAMHIWRVKYFGRKGNINAQILAAMLALWLGIVSSTDNTMHYPLFTTCMAILVMGQGFQQSVAEKDEQIFGHILPQNNPEGRADDLKQEKKVIGSEGS